MTWTGGALIEGFSDVKKFLGIIFLIAIAAVGASLMALVGAKNARRS